jgi:hypothetical protein
MHPEILAAGELKAIRENLFIFTSTGCLLVKIPWSNNSPVIAMGFNTEEELIIVEKNGIIKVINTIDVWKIKVKNIGSHIDECNIEAAKVFGDSVVIVSTKHKVIKVEDTIDWTVTELCSLYTPRSITEFFIDDIIIIDKKCSKSQAIEVIIPDRDIGFYWIYSGKSAHVTALAADDSIRLGKIDMLSLLPANKENIKILALVFDKSDLYIVMSNDIKGKAIKLKMDNGVPSSISYCGAITLIYQDEVAIIRSDSTTIEMEVLSKNGIIGFIGKDGLRLLTSDSVYFLETVNPKMADAFSLGSKALSSELLRAFQDFIMQSPNVEEMIEELMKRSEAELLDAVKSLISIGSRMWNSDYQKFIFRGILYTQAWAKLNDYDSQIFSFKLQEMRLFNLLRTPKYARLITYQEYKMLKQKKVINLLRKNRKYFLAIEFSKLYGKEDIAYLYEEWAINLVKNNKGYSEKDLYAVITNRVGGFHDVSYKAIAEAAKGHGYLKLATQLLQFTDPIQEQIPLLVSMSKHKDALKIALEACEYDVVNSILDRMRKQKLPVKETFKLFIDLELKYENSLKIFFAYAFQQAQLNNKYITIKEILECLTSLEKLGEEYKKLAESLKKTYINNLQEYELIRELIHNKKESEVITNGTILVKDSSTLPITKDIINQHITYLKFKEKTEKTKSLPEYFINNKTIIQSINSLLDSPALDNKISSITSELGLSKNVGYMLRLERLARDKDWVKFRAVASEKHHLPIKALIRICLHYANTSLAIEFIENMKESDEKQDLLHIVNNLR